MTAQSADLIWQMSGGTALEVVDVGANPIEGDAPYKALLDAGYARVTGFEPNADALAELNQRKGERETYHPHALGAGGPATLHLFRHSGFTSLFPVDQAVSKRMGFGRATRPQGTVEIQTERLDDLAEVPAADMLKIDVQGAETQIIANGRETLSGAMAVWTEVRMVPLYEGEPSFGDLDAELRDQGFMFHDFAFLKRIALGGRASKQKFRRRAFRQIVDGDAIYIRDPGGPGISDAQIFNLALLSVGVLQSYELALHCLDLLAQRGCIADADLTYVLRTMPEGLRLVEEGV